MSRPRAAQEAYARAAARLQRQRSKTHALARGLSYPSLRDTAGLRVKDTMPAAAGAMQATVSLHDFGGISSGRPEPRSSRARCHLRSEEKPPGPGQEEPCDTLEPPGPGLLLRIIGCSVGLLGRMPLPSIQPTSGAHSRALQFALTANCSAL
jgi:hypothetical protein